MLHRHQYSIARQLTYDLSEGGYPGHRSDNPTGFVCFMIQEAPDNGPALCRNSVMNYVQKSLQTS